MSETLTFKRPWIGVEKTGKGNPSFFFFLGGGGVEVLVSRSLHVDWHWERTASEREPPREKIKNKEEDERP